MALRRFARCGRLTAWWMGLLLWTCAGPVFASGPVLDALESSAPDEVVAEAADPTLPQDAASLVSGAVRVNEEKEELARVLTSLTDTDGRGTTLTTEAELIEAFGDYLDRFAKESFFRSRVLILHSRLISSRSRLDGVLERTAAEIETVQSMHDRWKARRAAWSPSVLRKVLEEDERNDLAGHIERARVAIDESLADLERTARALAALQDAALSLQARATGLLERLENELARGRQTRLRRDDVALWSNQAGLQLAESDFSVIAARVAWWDPGFIARTRGALFFHLLLAALVFVLARTFRGHASQTALQGGLWGHPATLAAFASTSLVHVTYQPAPPVLEAVLWTILGVSGVFLAHWALGKGSRRRAGLAMAGVYPLLAIIDTIGVPSVLLRWTVVLGGVLGALGTFWLRRRFSRARKEWIWWGPLTVSIGTFAVAAVAEAAGFASLGRYLLGATAQSGFLALTILFLVSLVDSTVEGALAWSTAQVTPRWRGVIPHFGRRLGWLVEAVLVMQGCLSILNIWELTPPANEAWVLIGRYSVDAIGLHLSVANVGLAFLSLYLARQVAWLLELVLDGTVLERHGFDAGIAHSIKTLVRYVLMGIGVIVAMGLVGIELRNIAIVAGALGIGIGFGLQSVVADFTSGLILLLERPLRTGDNVLIDQHWGVVKQIGLRSTVLRLLDESELVIPNSHMTTEKVQNFTLSSRAVRLFVAVGVAYGSNLEVVFKALEDVAAGEKEVLVEPPPEVLFMEFGPHSLKLELRVWIRRAETRLQVRSRLLRGIDRRFRERGVTVPFPQRDLHLRSIDEGAFAGSRTSPDAIGTAPGRPEEPSPPREDEG